MGHQSGAGIMEKAFGGVSCARFLGADAPGVLEKKQGENWRKDAEEGNGVIRSVRRLVPFLEGTGRHPTWQEEQGCAEE